jgi:Xaa-Pro aminopeptidase
MKVYDHCAFLQKWKRYFPHNIGHYLGMDVHDVSTVPNSVPLQRGMVVTVEPGVSRNVFALDFLIDQLVDIVFCCSFIFLLMIPMFPRPIEELACELKMMC